MTRARDVLAALKLRHSGDVFVPECNLGSATQGCRRIDAWVMPRSWSPFRTIGYEIKVSRTDFLNDDKYLEYGAYCHELWLACTWGLIAPEEVPPTIGLLWMNKGGKLVRKRKAVRAEGDTKQIMRAMAYILMSRCKIGPPTMDRADRTSREYWEEWLADRKKDAWVGLQVRDAIGKQVEGIRSKNQELQLKNESWQRLADKLRSIGLDPDALSSWNVEHKLDELRGVVGRSTIDSIERVAQGLTKLSQELKALRKDEIRE